MSNLRGERGPTGDHGQDGKQGPAGVQGRQGPVGNVLPMLNPRQVGTLLIIVLIAFAVLAWRSEANRAKTSEVCKRINFLVSQQAEVDVNQVYPDPLRCP